MFAQGHTASQASQTQSLQSKGFFSARTRQALDSLPDAQPTPHPPICSLSTQELPASGLVSEVLKETRVNLGPLANRAMWGSRDPVGPWETAAPKA